MGRRLLESFLTFKLPHFEAGKLEKKMKDISFDAAKKTRILRFLHVNSHNDQIGAPEHDISILSETRPVLSDLLDLIEAVDKEHFDGMIALLQPPPEEDDTEGE
ncbi:MAG: AAA family ATPase [Candidatus Thiodiazotropha endolucinida]|nr:AAA family ATPase [Candidatus Thiodiazotropha taylori]MCG8059461.1 AAA family ATPase [Candidatus Thiodiazotropha taylori]MCG8063487.1 AAA family ATPase [Candidatus Thiodiazotropha taylori]MCG8096802.1 AAA family ATPase [Candidatus Thiodiazotropha endolucinida]